MIRPAARHVALVGSDVDAAQVLNLFHPDLGVARHMA
jgi:hypothetical protein